MRTRGMGVILGLALVAAACGGGSEERIVSQYFGAVNAGDNQTLSSFAMVPFNSKVQKWEVNSASPETRSPASLPELIKKQKQLEADAAEHKKAWAAFRNDRAAEYNRYVEVKDKTKVPGNLQGFATEWAAFEQKDRDYRKQVSETKALIERERRNAQLSVGQLADLETLSGEVVDKTLDLTLTIDGQPKNYTMGLRKYDLQGGTGRVVSRWVVQSLQPKV